MSRRRSPFATPLDASSAVRALLGVATLAGTALLARAELALVLPRVPGAPPPAATPVAEALGTSSSARALIARVDVHPRRVCRGHDVVVEVVLTPGHETTRVAIAGRQGRRTVLRFGRTGREVVPIVARDLHDGVQVRHLRLTVEDCTAGAPRSRVARR